jgi:hypothetical protein
MPVNRHGFTDKITQIVSENTGSDGDEALEKSLLLQYLNTKTKAADRNSKSRAGFANHYALYVLLEDYLKRGFDGNSDYSGYGGVRSFHNFLSGKENSRSEANSRITP